MLEGLALWMDAPLRVVLCANATAVSYWLGLTDARGVGKTTLAQNLGLTALQHGYTVRFTTLAGALADLLKQESLPALDRRLRRYLQPDLLILDDGHRRGLLEAEARGPRRPAADSSGPQAQERQIRGGDEAYARVGWEAAGAIAR